MGAQPSKAKRIKSKDPKWQGIGPDTPIPTSTHLPLNDTNSNNYSRQSMTNKRNTTTTTNVNTKKPAAGKDSPNKSKIKLFFKVDPKKGPNGRPRKITKNLISLPSDFRHTGHIGAGEVRSGRIDPDKIKTQMMEVAACLRLDLDTPMPVLKTIPVQGEAGEQREALPFHAGPPPVERYGMGPSTVAAH